MKILSKLFLIPGSALCLNSYIIADRKLELSANSPPFEVWFEFHLPTSAVAPRSGSESALNCKFLKHQLLGVPGGAPFEILYSCPHAAHSWSLEKFSKIHHWILCFLLSGNTLCGEESSVWGKRLTPMAQSEISANWGNP